MGFSTHPQFLNQHRAEDGCGGCWRSFPRMCRCGGQIHAERGDESEAGDVWLRRWCSAVRDRLGRADPGEVVADIAEVAETAEGVQDSG